MRQGNWDSLKKPIYVEQLEKENKKLKADLELAINTFKNIDEQGFKYTYDAVMDWDYVIDQSRYALEKLTKDSK